MTGRCSTLIVDFDLPGAEEVIRMAALLPPGQKPASAGRRQPGVARHGSGVSVRRQPHSLPASRNRARQRRVEGGQKSAKIQPAQVRSLRSENSGLSRPRKRNASRSQHRYRRARPRPSGHRTRAHELEPRFSLRAARHRRDAARTRRRHLGQRSRPRRTLLLQARPRRPQASEALAPANAALTAKRKTRHDVRDLLPPEDAHVSFAASE